MARRASGLGKPNLRRAEPREFDDPTAAPEPLTAVREQVRVDDNGTGNRGQFGRFADRAIFSLERRRLVPCVVHLLLGGG